MKTKKSKPDPRLVAILRAYQAAEFQATLAYYGSPDDEKKPGKLDRMSDLADAAGVIQTAIACGLAFPVVGSAVEHLTRGASGYKPRRSTWLASVAADVRELVDHPTWPLRGHVLPASPPSESAPDAKGEHEISLEEALAGGAATLLPDDTNTLLTTDPRSGKARIAS